VRRIHAVQYISLPELTWERLRLERNGLFEKAVNPAPNPDGWFHAGIVIAKRTISVFINDAKEPCLWVKNYLTGKEAWSVCGSAMALTECLQI
jgi:hypothetical protein